MSAAFHVSMWSCAHVDMTLLPMPSELTILGVTLTLAFHGHMVTCPHVHM
jgi:hypothetical protein